MSHPVAKLTAKQTARLVQLAGHICITTPKKPNHYSRAAYVDWATILELREILTAAGYNLEEARQILEMSQ